MEENKKTTKSKFRAYLPIIGLGIVLVASAIGLGIAAINKSKNEVTEEVAFNSEFMTLEEIEALEEKASDSPVVDPENPEDKDEPGTGEEIKDPNTEQDKTTEGGLEAGDITKPGTCSLSRFTSSIVI